MNTFKKALIAAAMAAAVSPANALVTNVRYGIKYNSTTCKYDVYMKVLNGSTANAYDQEASTAQLCIVVTHGTTIGGVNGSGFTIASSAITNNEPKLGTLGGTPAAPTVSRTTPTAWTNSNVAIQRGALSNSDVYAFVPTVSNAFYPSLAVGDSVVLFSLSISTATCGSNVRLWNNNTVQGATVAGGDPTSATFNGDDYNNGMGIGSPSQIYASNSPLIGPPKPVITASRVVSGASILLNSSAVVPGGCTTIDAATFRWTGPAGYNQLGQNKVITPFTAANLGSYTVSVSDNFGCSNSLTLSSIPLPVTLAAFTANANKCSAALNWSTSSENGFDRFAVQYSADGSSYMTVGEVASRKSESGSDYSYSHAQTSGKGYYRLKMIDLNGTFTYSETISVSTSCGNAKGDISISPNPTSGVVNIRGIAAGTQVRIMDMIGKVVANEMSNGSALSVNLGAYANGIYNVLVSQDGAWEKVGQIVKN